MRMTRIGTCLDTWFLVGGAVWEGLGGMVLEEIRYWVRALMFQKDSRHFALALSFLLAIGDVSSQLLLRSPAAPSSWTLTL